MCKVSALWLKWFLFYGLGWKTPLPPPPRVSSRAKSPRLIGLKAGKRESIHKTAYFNSKAKTITNTNEIESELYASQQEILGIIEVWMSVGSGWTIDRVDNNYINVVNYKPLNG